MAKLLHKSSVENRIRTHFNNVMRLLELHFESYRTHVVETVQSAAFMDKLIDSGADNQYVSDKQIFACYELVIRQYESIVQAYQEVKTQIQNPEIRYILDGICQVLNAQISFYQENIQSFTLSDEDNNPLALWEYYQVQATEFFNQFSDYMKAHGFILLFVEEPPSIKACVNNFVSSSSSCLYGFYQKLFSMKREYQNSMERKQVFDVCYKQLQSEKENISDLITIQIKALEDVIEKDGADDKKYVQDILKLIREIHQHLGRRIQEFSAAYNDSEEEMKTQEMVLDMFLEPMQDIPEFQEEIFKQVQEFKLFFCKILFEILKQESGLNKMRYELRKNINEILSLCEELQNIFKKIIVLPNQDHDIMKGIQETIQIKDESIQENKQFYENSLIQQLQDIQYAMEQKAAFEIFQQWISTYGQKQTGIRDFLSDNEFWNQILQKQKNINKNLKDKVEKNTNHFLKEQLLFELSTFEEIMTYSIPRLKEEEDSGIRHYVLSMEKADKDIEFTLKKYNIIKIKPDAFEYFDGKEQEVLLAEKKEGYEKGQIVKVINSGYKFNGTVIMRANVVAAK